MLTKQKLRKGTEAGAVSVLENSWAALGEDEFRYSQLSKTEKLLDDVEKSKYILVIDIGGGDGALVELIGGNQQEDVVNI